MKMSLLGVNLAAAVLGALCMPGCVVWDIRNEMRNANARLGEVKATLDTANASLATANESLAGANARLESVENGLVRLDRTNTLIDGVGQGLSRIDTTNHALDGLEKQLALLASIETSLGRLDAHLASVRKTIGSIDSMIPFLDLGGGEDPTPTPAPTSPNSPTTPVAAGAPAATGAANPAPAEGAAEADVSAKRDLAHGIWVERYPGATALVILPDGRYWRSLGDAAQPYVEEGRWTREGVTLVFTAATPEPKQTNPAQVPAAGSAAAASPAPSPWKLTIVSVTARSLAARSESGALVLYGRP